MTREIPRSFPAIRQKTVPTGSGINDSLVSVYRGGNDFTIKPGEIRIDQSTGMVKSAHGVSLYVDPNKLLKFGGAYKIETIPDGLESIQRGTRAERFEIVPSKPMPVEESQSLLN